MGCCSARLENGSAAGGLFLRGDLAIVDRCFQRRFAIEQSGIEGICRPRITDHSDVILELNLLRVSQFKNRSVFNLNLNNGNVFHLIVTLASRRAILFDLERERAAVGNDDVVIKLEALQRAVLVDKTRVQAARILADLLGDLLHELPEQSLLCFVFTVVSHGDDVRISGDVAIGTDEEAGAESDGGDVERLSLVAGRLKPNCSLRAIDNTNHCRLAVHGEALAVRHGVDDAGTLRGKQCNDQKKSACCNKKQSAHRESSLGMFIGSQLCQVSNGKEDLPAAKGSEK